MNSQQHAALAALHKQLADMKQTAESASNNARAISASFGVTSREASTLDPIMLTTAHIAEQMDTARGMVAGLIPSYPSRPPKGATPIEEK